MPNRKPVIISPSLLSADFVRLGEAIELVKAGGAPWLHIDVMDGHFVPNISIGIPVVRSLRKSTDLFLDCHLMISEPERYVEAFAEAGADMITVHLEACTHLDRVVQQIHNAGKKAGVSINPATPVGLLEEILPKADMILLMSVNPGFGGQSFIPSLFRRAKRLRDWIDQEGYDCLIEADGGIKLDNIEDVYRAGVDVVVSGSGIYGESDPTGAVRQMREICKRSLSVKV